MKLWCLLIFLCGAFTRISSQVCTAADEDFVCTTDGNVAICLDSTVPSTGDVIINCANDLTCNTVNPINGCVNSQTTTATSSTERGTCVDNYLKLAKSNCRSYYKCVNGAMRTYTCPDRTCFSDEKKACKIGSCNTDGVCT